MKSSSTAGGRAVLVTCLMFAVGFAHADCGPLTRGAPEAGNGVLVIGAVQQPQTLAPEPGMRVSDALAATGGLHEAAYPLGAMLLRRMPQYVSLTAGDNAGKAIPLSKLSALQLVMSGSDEPCMPLLAARVASGAERVRLPVAIDVVDRRRFPDRDQRLAPGDVLYIPFRPSAVLLLGAVRVPGPVTFSAGSVVRDYISEAGGRLRGARGKDAVVYLPDGTVRSLAIDFWNYQPENVPPGSLIVLPGRRQTVAEVVAQGLEVQGVRTEPAAARDATDTPAQAIRHPRLRVDEALTLDPGAPR